MSHLNIELSKAYTDAAGAVVVIVGEIPNEMIEFQQDGFKYYSSTGDLYRPDGTSFEHGTPLVRDSAQIEIETFDCRTLRSTIDSDVDNIYRSSTHPLFKVEEGRQYINRMGFKVDPDEIADYFDDGSYQYNVQSIYDIVYEITEPKGGFAITIGKNYKTRNGQAIVSIIGYDDTTSNLFRSTHPFLGDDGEVYTPIGHFNENIESEYDLVEEV